MSIKTQQHINKQTNTQSQSPQSASRRATPGGLMEIGRPIGIRSDLDYNEILRNRILSKMSIIDLVPVDAIIQFLKAGEAAIHANVESVISNLLPKVKYDNAISDFAGMCQKYGLNPYSGVRLYIVDESTVVDEIRHEYSENVLQSIANRLSNSGQQIYELGKSLGTKYDETVDKAAEKAMGVANAISMGMLQGTEIGKTASTIAKTLGKIVLKGTRISLPKIWRDSSYTSQTSCVVKLVSPYGTPKSILNYIAKPLLALLLIASAVSDDGVSYGYPRMLSIQAYGLGKIVFGGINSISIRRGGADTSFNKYRQPLSVDLSITFEEMVSGYAALKNNNSKEHGVLGRFTQFAQDTTTWTGNLSLLNTPGKIIDSLRPVNLVNYESQTNKGFISIDTPVPQEEAKEEKEVSLNRQADPTLSASSAVRNDISNSGNTGSTVEDPGSLGIA